MSELVRAGVRGLVRQASRAAAGQDAQKRKREVSGQGSQAHAASFRVAKRVMAGA
ncbi:hypothetical protein GLE_3670 [Lysobacter enzymogenes]|uniref:Uncharacterized protein n=1 Tax=Lysobacter enzymogenes TaxID=69 RepID=A0A0S2DK72_LYSEN|nr:hypothetical protein GLE_3670 [Lysobacter enzymogenes]